MDYQVALEACRAYKACHVTLRRLGINDEADVMRREEERWRAAYITLADKQNLEIGNLAE